jgi:thymidylate kinase
MLSVALIGPDGAGKTTVSQRLAGELKIPVKTIYLGVNTESSNVMLPTTRILRRLKRAMGAPPDNAGPPDPFRVKTPPRGLRKRILWEAKAWLRLLYQLSEEWYRLGVASVSSRRGILVLFDRHYYSDFHAYEIAQNGRNLPVQRRIHGFFLEHLYPRPGLVIFLDAPGDVLLARKGEGTVEALERRRKDYWQIKDRVAYFEVVDASQPLDEVVRQTRKLIEFYYESQMRKTKRMKANVPGG